MFPKYKKSKPTKDDQPAQEEAAALFDSASMHAEREKMLRKKVQKDDKSSTAFEEEIKKAKINIADELDKLPKTIKKIEEEDTVITVMDATVSTTFDGRLKVGNQGGSMAVIMVYSWLYNDINCRAHFGKYDAVKTQVAYALSKAVVYLVNERAPVINFVHNFITPGFKHFYTDPHVNPVDKEKFVETVKQECKVLDKKFGIST